ncbi:MAG: DUF434 domain-containing protein [Methanotrichaceae archaeon]
MLKRAADDVRHLLGRGYPKESAIRFVADHYRLPEWQRYALVRVIIPSAQASSRKAKLVSPGALNRKEILIDGYNVLITVESILEGCPVYLCDDRLLRDIRGIFRKYRPSEITDQALSEIIDLLASVEPARVEFLLDQQISMSGSLASHIREMMSVREIPGTARTEMNVDHNLKIAKEIVATSDGNVIDKVCFVVDIPMEIARRKMIEPLIV